MEVDSVGIIAILITSFITTRIVKTYLIGSEWISIRNFYQGFYTQAPLFCALGPLFCALVREKAIFAVCQRCANESFACTCKEKVFFIHWGKKLSRWIFFKIELRSILFSVEIWAARLPTLRLFFLNVKKQTECLSFFPVWGFRVCWLNLL